MRALLMFLLVCVSTLPALAQSGPDTLWTQTYGGGGNDWCYAVQEVGAGGLIFAGQSNSSGAGFHDVLVIRTDEWGDTLWTRTYGGPANEGARALRVVGDTGFIIAGSTVSYGAGGSDVYLIRIGSTGDTLWTRTFGGPASDYGRGVVATPDGGFAVAGITNSFGAGSSDVYLIKTDADGNLEWSSTYGSPLADEGRSLELTADGGFVVGGATWRQGGTWSDALLVRTTALGDTLWTRTYGGSEQDWINAITLTREGGYIAAGQTWLPGANNADIYLLRLHSNGDTVWTRTLSGPGADEAFAVGQTSDGGYFAAGSTSPVGSLVPDYYMVKTDSVGLQEWARVYGGSQPDVAYAAIQTANEGFLLGGETLSYGNGGYNMYIIATSAAPLPGDTVRDLRVHYYPDGDGVVLYWTVPRAGDYNIFSTISSQSGGDPAEPGWELETTLHVSTPVARWVDPGALEVHKYYLVVRDYGLFQLRRHQQSMPQH